MTPLTGLERPLGFKDVEDPRFCRQSAEECVAGRLNLPRDIPGRHFYKKLRSYNAKGIEPENFRIITLCLN
jgi:hypothetical protein